MRRGRLAKYAKTLAQEAEKINLSVENNKITMQIPSSFQAATRPKPQPQPKQEDSDFEEQSAGEEEFLDGEAEDDSQLLQGEEEAFEEDPDLGPSEDSRLDASDSVPGADQNSQSDADFPGSHADHGLGKRMTSRQLLRTKRLADLKQGEAEGQAFPFG